MSHSNDNSERIRERPEEDIIEPRPASNEFEISNQPHRDLPATPQPQPSDQLSIRSAETEQDKPRQGAVPSKASNRPPVAEPNARPKTLFGLKKQVKEQSVPAHFNRFDYEQKYPRDPFRQERAENARVWLTYLDEAESYDRDKIDGWKDTVDVLLVFAGLFSGVVTTFLSQTSQNLQQNYTQVSASLLYEIAQLHRAQLTGASIVDVPHSPLTPNSSFTPSTNASVVNGLWLTSLGISLCTALFAVLTKQWLYYYQSPVSGTARDKVLVSQFRFEGLEKWRFAVIIDLLPILLHLALGLFLIGLAVFILPLDVRIVWIIIILSGFTYILYLVSILLPIRYPQCPYVTPLTIYVDFFIQPFQLLFHYIFFRLLRHIRFQLRSARIGLTRLSIYRDRFFSKTLVQIVRNLRYSLRLFGSPISKAATRVWNSLKARYTTTSRTLPVPSSREARVSYSIKSATAMLQDKALHWLLSTSSNPAVSRIVTRTVHISPNFGAQQELYDQLSTKFHNLRITEWDEDSLPELLENSEFLEDLYHGLHLMVLSGDRFPNIATSIQERFSASLHKDIKERYPELFSIISVQQEEPEEVLLRGLQDDTLKLFQGVWLCLLQRARKDNELASQIICSGTFNLFDWHGSEQPSVQIDHTETIHLAKQLPQDPHLYSFYERSFNSELNRSAFSYLFRCFVVEHFPDDGSFLSRYFLFIAIYRNLISNEPLIDDPALRTRALKYLLATFSFLPATSHECIRGQVITAPFINRMPRDMLMHDSFSNGNMSSDLQEAAISCCSTFWKYQMRTTGDVSLFFAPQKEELEFIYQWSSKGNACALFVQQLFMPDNLSNLRMLLVEDRDHAKSNLRNCLGCLLPSSRSMTLCKHQILYEEYIIPNVINLFTTTILSDGSDPLFSVLCDPSVLAQAWELLAIYPLYLYKNTSIPCPMMDRSRAVLALLPSRFDSESLRNVYDSMIGRIENSRICVDLHPYPGVYRDTWDPITMRRACISAYTFGRMAGLVMDPTIFNLPSRVIDGWAFQDAFKDITCMRNELERQYMEEKRKHTCTSLFQFLRIPETFRALWIKKPGAEVELDAMA